MLRALLFLSVLLGPGRCSSVLLELATRDESTGVSRSKPNWSKERLKVGAVGGRERRRCGGSGDDMMVVEENTMVPVWYASLVLVAPSFGNTRLDYRLLSYLSVFLLPTIIMLLARRALFLARCPRPFVLQSKLIHSVAQTDRVLLFTTFIILFLCFLTGNNNSSFVLHRNQTRG